MNFLMYLLILDKYKNNDKRTKTTYNYSTLGNK